MQRRWLPMSAQASKRRRRRPPHPLVLGILTVLVAIARNPGAADAKKTFSIDYIVAISKTHPEVADVRWELSGIEEVKWLGLRFAADRFKRFRGTGTLKPMTGGLRWVPGGPYAHLTYRVRIDHTRGRAHRYDSYAAADWVVARARDLFPRISIDCEPHAAKTAKSRARLIFRLPPGWRSATALTSIGPETYRPNEPGKILDRPRGWVALGKLAIDHQEIAEVMVQVARAPGSRLEPKQLFHFLERTLPALKRLLSVEPGAVLLVSAPDPMWHGGLSAAHSFFMHGDRPLRTPDKTSPYLHELFHVWQPYKVSSDADWIEEGLAEFYSLELQRRAGLIDAKAFARALGYFERYGLWNVNLMQQKDNPATNNSAPLIMYVLDQRIQRATAGKARLDDVVKRLVTYAGTIDTDRFQRAVSTVSGKRFTRFFNKHVLHGVPPSLGSPQ